MQKVEGIDATISEWEPIALTDHDGVKVYIGEVDHHHVFYLPVRGLVIRKMGFLQVTWEVLK